jgi:hypothetical protein
VLRHAPQERDSHVGAWNVVLLGKDAPVDVAVELLPEQNLVGTRQQWLSVMQ